MPYNMLELTNSLPVILSPSPETPRIALAVTMKGGVARETIPGTAKLANRLLLKGTESRTAEQLALELDERAIDLREYAFADSSALLAIFINREFDAVLEILRDILLNSTFADFEKEAVKLAGEIQSAQDVPAEVAQDLLTRTLFPNHPYGHTGTRMLERLGSLSREAVRDWYHQGVSAPAMNVTMVGDFNPDEVMPKLQRAFGDFPTLPQLATPPALTPLSEGLVVTQERPDAQQAQVYQGWYAPPLGNPQQASMIIMNTILGGGGLSNRLFVELRDKRGLAYSVRSHYLPMRQTGEFIISIGTSPENIGRAREGFAEQLNRMQEEPVSENELAFAKGRVQGSYILGNETNSRRCLDMAVNHIQGVGADFSERLLAEMQQVTIDDVLMAAKTINPPAVTAIVARAEALHEITK